MGRSPVCLLELLLTRQRIEAQGVLVISLDQFVSVFFSGRALETTTLAGLSSRSWNR